MSNEQTNYKQADDDLLQQYLDGALDETRAAEVHARIESDPIWRKRAADLRLLNETVRAKVSADEASLDSDVLFQRIDAVLHGAKPQAPVLDIKDPARRGSMRNVLIGAGAVLALAAAVVLYATRTPTHSNPNHPDVIPPVGFQGQVITRVENADAGAPVDASSNTPPTR